MHKNATTNILRYLAIALVGSAGLAGIIATGGCGGGGGDTPPPPPPPPPKAITSIIEGMCKKRISGLGEEMVTAELRRPLATPQGVSVITPQQTALPASELVASTQTDAAGFYRFEAVPANETHFLTYAKADFLDEAYFEVSVEPDTTETLEPVPLIETQFNTIFGFISGTVANARTGEVLPGVAVRVRGGINNRIGAVLREDTTNVDGAYAAGALDGGNYTLEASLPGFQTAYFDALVLDVDVNGGSLIDETIVGTVALVSNDLAGASFSISGNLFAAYDQVSESGPFALGGAAARIREGINTTVGTVTAEGFTQASGLYSLSQVLAGQYTLEGALTGFNAGFIDIAVASNLENQNVTLMPLLSDGSQQITTVLTWGTTTDLDGRLFEIEPEPVLVPWLNDDTDGFGPETTLLAVVDPGKRYEYFVEDFRRTLLSASKAQVRVHRGNNLIFTFDLPLSDPDAATAVDWHVFTIEQDTIVPVNDLGPNVDIADASALEHDPGDEFVVDFVVFDVTLNGVSSGNIVLDMTTEEDTATADVDYETSNFQYSTNDGQTWVPAGGPTETFVTIPAGQTAIKVRVPTIRDNQPEDDETFTLRISEVISGSVGNFSDRGIGTILNDDGIGTILNDD